MGKFLTLSRLSFRALLSSVRFRGSKKAKAAGCEVKLSVYEGMFHVFQLGMKKMKESRQAWREIDGFINQ